MFLKVEYNGSHKHPLKLCGFHFSFSLCELTQFAILWSGKKRFSDIEDSVSSQSKRKTHAMFRYILCGSLYSTFKTSFRPHSFHDKLFHSPKVPTSRAVCLFKFTPRSCTVYPLYKSMLNSTD